MQIETARLKQKRRLMKEHPHIKEYLKRRGTLYLALEGARCLGFASVQKRKMAEAPGLCEDLILLIEVFEPEERAKGIASALVQKVLQQAAVLKRHQVVAHFEARNVASHRLWVKNGFSITPVFQKDGAILDYWAVYPL